MRLFAATLALCAAAALAAEAPATAESPDAYISLLKPITPLNDVYVPESYEDQGKDQKTDGCRMGDNTSQPFSRRGPDGSTCTICTCIDGSLSCSARRCEDEVPRTCGHDIRRCSDGMTVVTRDPTNACEFAPCPEAAPVVANETEGVDNETVPVCPDDVHRLPSGRVVSRNPYDGCRFFSEPETVDPSDVAPVDSDAEATAEDDKTRRLNAEVDAESSTEEEEEVELVPAPADEYDTEFTVKCKAGFKECPDGSYVRRMGSDCQFPDCAWSTANIEPTKSDEDSSTSAESDESAAGEDSSKVPPGGLGRWRVVPRMCRVKNMVIRDGWTGRGYGANNRCNLCRCDNGVFGCTRFKCPKADFGIRSCETPEGKTVEHGWTGKGNGDDWCKNCECHDGRYYCSSGVCPKKDGEATKPMCVIGGETVADGWTGKGTGDDWCKSCTCEAGFIKCSGDACGEPAQEDESESDADAVVDGEPETEPSEETECTLASGKTVPYGWEGNDDLHNYCNSCKCDKNGELNCGEEPEECEPRPEDLDDEEDTLEKPSDDTIPPPDLEAPEDDEAAPELSRELSDEEPMADEEEEPVTEEGDAPADEQEETTTDEDSTAAEEEAEAEKVLKAEDPVAPYTDQEDVASDYKVKPLPVIGKSKAGKEAPATVNVDGDDEEVGFKEQYETGAECRLPSGTVVPHGFGFNPKDDNHYCQSCVCSDGEVYCSEIVCPAPSSLAESDSTSDEATLKAFKYDPETMGEPAFNIPAPQESQEETEDSTTEPSMAAPDKAPESQSSTPWYKSSAVLGGVGGAAGVVVVAAAVAMVLRRRSRPQNFEPAVQNPVASVASEARQTVPSDITAAVTTSASSL